MRKEYTIKIHGRKYDKEITGTIDRLTKHFSYTLLVGKSWEHERGNRKVNLNPKTAKSLVENLNNAECNAAANGMACRYYELVNT